MSGPAPRLDRRLLLGTTRGVGLTACAADDGPPSRAPSPGPSAGPTFDVEVRDRTTWGARPAVGAREPLTVEQVTIHHSAYRLRDNRDAAAQARAIQREHQRNQWPDIAYHYLVDLEGTPYAGRDPATTGDSFTPYDLTGHLLVCLLGHFDRQPLGPAQRDGLTRVVAWALHEHDLDAAAVRGHDDREPSTSCPGRPVSRLVRSGALAADVEALLATGTPVLRLTA